MFPDIVVLVEISVVEVIVEVSLVVVIVVFGIDVVIVEGSDVVDVEVEDEGVGEVVVVFGMVSKKE